jgi:hypothetical protein
MKKYIDICVVLYKCCLSESLTISNLKSIKSELINNIYIYCNSDNLVDIDLVDYPNFIIIENESNCFLLENYNKVLEYKNNDNSRYLLTLDQDTDINQRFFNILEIEFDKAEKYDVYYPMIQCGKFKISPLSLSFGLPSNVILSGININTRFVGINSGCVISNNALKEILNSKKSNYFKLDYLDYYISNEIYKKNLKVKVINVILNHSLSVAEEKRINSERAMSILGSEKMFFTKVLPKRYLIFYGINYSKRFIMSVFIRNYIYSTIDLIKALIK